MINATFISSAYGASSGEVIGSGRGQSHAQFRHLTVGIEKNVRDISNMGTAVAQWLRCCATNSKFDGSIPAGDIGIFH